MAEWAEQLGKMMEQPNQSQHNPGPRANGTPCSVYETFTSLIEVSKSFNVVWEVLGRFKMKLHLKQGIAHGPGKLVIVSSINPLSDVF